MRWLGALVVGCAVAVAGAGVTGPVATAQGQADRTPKGYLLALDATTGEPRWRVATPGFFEITDVSSSTVAGRGFPCTGKPFETIAYRAQDGDVRWRAGSSDGSSAVRGGNSSRAGSTRSGIVVMTPGNHGLDGRDARDGRRRWSADAVRQVAAERTATRVVVSTSTGADQRDRLMVLDRKTGRELWSERLDGFENVYGQVGDSVVAVSMSVDNGFRRMQIRDLDAGTLLWESALPGGVSGSLVLVYDNVTHTTEARSARDGAPVWRVDGAINGAASGVLVRSGPTAFSVIDPATGGVRWTAQGARPVFVSSTLVGVAEANGTEVSARDASSGVERWRVVLPLQDPEPDLGSTVNSGAVARDAVYLAVGCFPNAD